MQLYGYIRASTAVQVASPAVQEQTIRDYVARMLPGRDIIFYTDPATSGTRSIWEREAGGELMKVLRPGDTVVCARLDRISRSAWNFGKMLEEWIIRKVALHVCDLPNGVFDPSSPLSLMIMQILVVFAQYERGLIRSRTMEGKAAVAARGFHVGGDPPFGMMCEKRWDSVKKRYANFLIPDPRERQIAMKCVEMRASGYSIRQIRDYLCFDWKVRSRRGQLYAPDAVVKMIRMGLRWMNEQEQAARTVNKHVNETLEAVSEDVDCDIEDLVEEDP